MSAITFRLAAGDPAALTRAYNVLRTGAGTHLDPCDANTFVAAWANEPVAFESEHGFVGVKRLGSTPQGLLAVAPYTPALGPVLAGLLREIARAHNLVAIRATSITPDGDALLDAAGMVYDGCMRRAVGPVQNGAGPHFVDMTMWSYVPELDAPGGT